MNPDMVSHYIEHGSDGVHKYFKLSELKDECRARGLKATGNKQELVVRLAEQFEIQIGPGGPPKSLAHKFPWMHGHGQHRAHPYSHPTSSSSHNSAAPPPPSFSHYPPTGNANPQQPFFDQDAFLRAFMQGVPLPPSLSEKNRQQRPPGPNDVNHIVKVIFDKNFIIVKVPYYMSMDGFLEEALSKMGYGFSHLYTLSFPNGRSFIGPHHLAENNKTNKKLSTFGITPGMITPLSYDHMPFKLVFEGIEPATGGEKFTVLQTKGKFPKQYDD